MMKKNIFLLLLFVSFQSIVYAKGITKTTLYKLGTILKKNNKLPIGITKAWYGSSKQQIDVKSFFHEHATKGMLYIPLEMRSTFGIDPDPGEAKKLDITFVCNEKEYNLVVDELWHVPAWYNFLLDEEKQVLTMRASYVKAIKCSIEELLALLKQNEKRPFKVISAQWGKLKTQKIADMTKKLDACAKSGIFMLPERSINICCHDPAPEVDKKIQIVFEMDGRWYQLTLDDIWALPVKRSGYDDIINNLLIKHDIKEDLVFLKAPYHQYYVQRLQEILTHNAGKPFTIQKAIVVQPWFKDIHYDVTIALQDEADKGILSLPKDLKSLVKGQGIEPYMYVMKVIFTMDGITHSLTCRNDFTSIHAVHDDAVQALMRSCENYIAL